VYRNRRRRGSKESTMAKETINFRDLPKTKFPKVIPPGSLVILAKIDAGKSPDGAMDGGRIFGVGYYNPNDGLDCIWLVNADGAYEQTVDRNTLLDHFLLLRLSKEADLYGRIKKPLKALRKIRRRVGILATVP
jgi:hypothetical protein